MVSMPLLMLVVCCLLFTTEAITEEFERLPGGMIKYPDGTTVKDTHNKDLVSTKDPSGMIPVDGGMLGSPYEVTLLHCLCPRISCTAQRMPSSLSP